MKTDFTRSSPISAHRRQEMSKRDIILPAKFTIMVSKMRKATAVNCGWSLDITVENHRLTDAISADYRELCDARASWL